MPIALAERTFDLGGLRLFGIEAGDGPTLLFFHGITANAYVWLPVMAALADRFRVIALDQRGHGRSGKPAGQCYDAEQYAGDIVALAGILDAMPLGLVGHSLGARNAIVAASRNPTLFSAVVAIDFTAFIETERFNVMDGRVGSGDRSFASMGEAEAYLSGRYTRLPDDAIVRRARHGFASDADGRLRPLADAAAMAETCRGLREDLVPELRALAVPTLLVRGQDSAFISAEAFERSAALRADFSTLVVADADHYVHEEQPDEIARAIARFVTGAQ